MQRCSKILTFQQLFGVKEHIYDFFIVISTINPCKCFKCFLYCIILAKKYNDLLS